MITLNEVNTCEKRVFDSLIKDTYPGLKLQTKLKSNVEK